MFSMSVDPSIVQFEADLLKEPDFDQESTERFYQDVNSTEEDIWNMDSSYYSQYRDYFQNGFKDGTKLATNQSYGNRMEYMPIESPLESEMSQDSEFMAEENEKYPTDIDLAIHANFIESTVLKISEGAKTNSKRPYRLDELFKKVIRALSAHMRKQFDDYIHDIDAPNVSEAEMEERLKSFLKTQYNLTELEASEILVAKKVFYSIAIKSRQLTFGSEFSVIIRNLRCEFVEIGTKKSGLAFFNTIIGKVIFWPIFRRIITRILDEGNARLQLKYLVKSFDRFLTKVQV